MATVRLKYVHRYKDRLGIVRHYLRRPGMPKVRLPGTPGSAAFMAAYMAALAIVPKPKETEPDRAITGSFDALAAEWYRSNAFTSLAPSTQAVYRRNLDRIRAEHGHKLVADLATHNVRHLMEAKQGLPAAANHILRMLRLLMKHAVANRWRADDPTVGVKKFAEREEGAESWSEAHIARFEAYWPVGSRARLAMALLLYTGQRRSDVIRMGPGDMRGGAIHVRQQKTRTELLIPVHPALKSVLAGVPEGQKTFLAVQGGGPFASTTAFYNWFVQSVRAAGLPAGLSPHGLRKAAARRLAEAGCSMHEIAAITGHKTLSEVSRYTKAAEQKKLAEAAMRRILEAK